MKQTDNLKLRLYDSDDLMNITGPTNSLNHNMGIIDEAINNTQKELTTQSGRIDNLILNSGDSSTEVIDARVDTDGKTYSTLKERLDTENSKIKSECSTYSTKTEVSVVEGKADDALAAANANSENLTNFINTTTNNLEDLQGQLDGSIMTHFYEYEPTNTNIPASEWTTTELKNNHLGDLFYDTITGYCYRWQVSNNTYSWNRITDVDVTKALADAAKAQDTADNKRRVFVSTPTPPYDVGDLWTQGSDGDIMHCKIAKTSSQSYAAADWEKASKYTDDTKADAVADNLANTNANLSNVTTNLSKAQQDILTNAGLIDSQGDLIAGNTAEIQSQAETISNHESRISKTETDISLKVSSSDFESYKTTVTGTIDTAKSEAINAASEDAISKADQALANAKNYTSAEIETVNESISKANAEITAMKGQIALKVEQSDIDNVETTVKTYVDGEVADTLKEAKTYTDEREAAINVTLNGISSKVSSVESSQTTINGNVSDLQTRMSSAEEKITPTAIINTVSSTYATKTENQAALDAAKAAQEDINNLEIGGRNLLLNSSDLLKWEKEELNVLLTQEDDGYYKLSLKEGAASTLYGIYQTVSVEPDTDYIFSMYTRGWARIQIVPHNTWSALAEASHPSDIASSEESRLIIKYNSGERTQLRVYTCVHSSEEEYIKLPKFEKGSKPTDWTPAPEDVDASVREAKTTAEQTADKFTWLVASGTSSSDFTLTDRVASLLSSEFQIDALTTFKNSATDGTSTVIDGGAIKANTISADKINVPDLSALRATIGGFTIGNSALHNGTTSLAGADNSVYLGLDGISCGTKFKVDKNGVLSTADIKMEKTKTENDITSTFGLYISSPDSWTGSGLAVPEIKTETKTVVDGVTHSNTLMMYPFTISLEQYVTDTDATWLRLEPTKMSMFSYINNNGFKCPELFIQPGGANSASSVTMGQETHQIYSVKWTDDPYDYDDPLANCPYNMYPIKFNASTVTFNSAVDVLSSLKVNGTDVSLDGHKHGSLYHTSSGNVCLTCIQDSDTYYVRKGSSMSDINVCSGSGTYPWYNVYTENLRVSGGKPIFSYVGSDGGGSVVSYATNMYVGSNGTVSRTTNTSSRTIKHDITELQDEQIKAENLYNVNVYQAKYNEDILSSNDPRYLKDLPMFIIEDLDEKYPIIIDKPSENVKEWSWNAQYIIPPMLKLIQNQHQTDINLENKIKDLESKLDKALEIINNLTNN